MPPRFGNAVHQLYHLKTSVFVPLFKIFVSSPHLIGDMGKADNGFPSGLGEGI